MWMRVTDPYSLVSRSPSHAHPHNQPLNKPKLEDLVQPQYVEYINQLHFKVVFQVRALRLPRGPPQEHTPPSHQRIDPPALARGFASPPTSRCAAP